MKEEGSTVIGQWHYGEVMNGQRLTSTNGRTKSAANINKH
jgi:hypothetical protein